MLGLSEKYNMRAKAKMVCEHVICSQHESIKSSLASALRRRLFFGSLLLGNLFQE